MLSPDVFDISPPVETWGENEVCSSHSEHHDLSVRDYRGEIIGGKVEILPAQLSPCETLFYLSSF